MNPVDTTKSIIENLYFLSGPVLAIFGFFIFRQIKLAKEQLKIAKDQLNEAQKQLIINSTRDSIKLAAEQIRFYTEIIIPCHDRAFGKLKEMGLKRVEFKTTSFAAVDILNSANLTDILEYLKKAQEINYLDLNTLNSLETFSTYFVQKVADEKVAFQSIGISFCNTVESLALNLSIGRRNQTKYFEDVIILFRLWQSRINQQNLENQKETLENALKKQIGDIEAKIKNNKTSKISALGTE